MCSRETTALPVLHRTLVLMTAGAMRMAMGAFFGTCVAYRNYLYIKGQIDTGQRVIGIHIDVELANFHDCGRTGPVLTT